MSSSTSSSDDALSRRLYGKILLAVLVGMIAALGLLRLFTDLNDASADTILGRVGQAQAALPVIIDEEKDLAMFFGSSMVQAGFSPRMFDLWMSEKGLQISSWNFGFGGLNPYFQEILSRRISEQFVARDRKLKLVMIEFNPFQTTQNRWNGALPLLDSFMTMLATDQELFDIAKSDMTRGVRLFTIRYLRNDISAEMVTQFFGESLQERPQESTIAEDEAMTERRNEINELLDGKLAEDYPDYDGEDWYLPWQGGGTIPMDRSEQTVDLIKELIRTYLTDRNLENDRLGRIRSADIIELQFEELLVESFIQLVKNFQQISEHVEIILLPVNRDWIVNSPSGKQRLANTLERISRETGITIRNMQDVPEITPDMYSDTTHLGRYTGDIPFTRLLVDEIEPLLKNN
ncbi:MAG: hypothetical protein ACI9H8_000528 [Lysobacterales bacterium]